MKFNGRRVTAIGIASDNMEEATKCEYEANRAAFDSASAATAFQDLRVEDEGLYPGYVWMSGGTWRMPCALTRTGLVGRDRGHEAEVRKGESACLCFRGSSQSSRCS